MLIYVNEMHDIFGEMHDIDDALSIDPDIGYFYTDDQGGGHFKSKGEYNRRLHSPKLFLSTCLGICQKNNRKTCNAADMRFLVVVYFNFGKIYRLWSKTKSCYISLESTRFVLSNDI